MILASINAIEGMASVGYGISESLGKERGLPQV